MAKPILVIRAGRLLMSEIDVVRGRVCNLLDNEYHVIMVTEEVDSPLFSVYNVDKEPEIDYEQLKELINGTRG